MTLSDYNMEAHGNRLADYSALKPHGPAVKTMWQMDNRTDLPLFEKVSKNLSQTLRTKRIYEDGSRAFNNFSQQ